MDLDLLFRVCNGFVMPFWVLILAAPRWRFTDRLVHSVAVPVLLGAVYTLLLVGAPPPPPGAGFDSLDGVMKLLSQPQGALAGWVHYLAFDLFVGAWVARDASRRGIHPLAVAPCLMLTLMLGPLGLALYAALRGVLRRTGTLVEGEAVG